jgi:hypothetical protein
MYKSKIRSALFINKDTGEVRLKDLDIEVDGYKDKEKLREARESFNSEEELLVEPVENYKPKGIWYYMLEDFYKRLMKLKRIAKNK